MKPEVLRRATIAAGVALLSVSLGACDLAMSGYHEEARDIFSKTYPLAENGRLEIVNTNGSIKVDPSDGSQVEVRAERIARAATQQGAKELLAANEIKEDISSDRVHLDSRSQGKFLRGGVEVRYTIRVPAGAVVDLRNTNGTVEASGMTHGARLSTTNGRVTGHGLGGEVHASTTNGAVDLEMRSLTNDVEVSTTNGGISLEIPPSASAEISASVTNGGIRFEGLPGLTAADENSRRRFSGRLNDGDHRIRLSTTNGGINISGRSASTAAESKSDRKKTEQPVER